MSEALAVIGLVFAAWTLLMAARESLQPRRLDPGAQLRGLLLSYASVIGFVLFLQIEMAGWVAWLALLPGAGAGYLISQNAGYVDDYGDVMAKGSAGYLAPVAASLAIMVWGTLDVNADTLAAGVLLSWLSLGFGTGQVLFAWQACTRVERAWDAYIDSLYDDPATQTAPGTAAYCPNGHLLPEDQTTRFCHYCGEPSRCPNGHLAQRSSLAFCLECGAAMRG